MRTGKTALWNTALSNLVSSPAPLQWTAVLAAGALMLSGCNSGSSPSGPSGGSHGASIDPCTLVTQADAEAIMGEAVASHTDTTVSASTYIRICTYYGSVKPGAILPTRLTIDAFTDAGIQAALGPTQSAANFVSALKANLPAGYWVAQAGVGTDAIYRVKEGKLSFYKGDVAADISYAPKGTGIDTSAVAREGAVTAGTDAAARL